ncbi:MAG: hypothetical protein KAI74_06610 [Kiritimatiellae bacterium]|nr:hypothetical protein [Kiritimatiellia bacterium]
MNKIYILIIITVAIYASCFTYAEAETNSISGAETDIMTIRDPFWTPGWKPPNFGKKKSEIAAEAKAKADAEALALSLATDLTETNTGLEKVESPTQWNKAGRILKISGLTQTPNGSYIAVIKGYGLVKEGDDIAVKYKGLTYKWRITKVTKQGISRKRLTVSQ